MREEIYCVLDCINTEGMTNIYYCSDCKREPRVDGDHMPKDRICRGPEARKLRREDRTSS